MPLTVFTVSSLSPAVSFADKGKLILCCGRFVGHLESPRASSKTRLIVRYPECSNSEASDADVLGRHRIEKGVSADSRFLFINQNCVQMIGMAGCLTVGSEGSLTGSLASLRL